MLTKAIILGRKQGTNKYTVRIPYFESAGGRQSIFDATLCITPGVTESYKKDDVVFVGFEDHEINNVIILGKLYLPNDNSTSRGFANLDALEVNGEVKLPKNTTIGGFKIPDLASAFEMFGEVKESSGGDVTISSITTQEIEDILNS